MSEEKDSAIDVYTTPTFDKAFKKLSSTEKDLVEDEIDNIIADPEIGTRKKGDLSHLWVHKFKMNRQEVLLGYSWVENKVKIYLFSLASHENFYSDQRKRRKANLKLIGG